MERPYQRGRGTLTDFFADSYAILALLNGDEAYARRFRNTRFRTGWLNLYEAYAAQLAREVLAPEAAANLAPFEASAGHADWETLQEAARFRHEMRKEGKNCSYVDAAGYASARSLGVPFLTGDPAFQDLPGVELLVEKRRKTR